MKDAKEVREYHKQQGEASTMGPACPCCGRMENEGTVLAYRGFCNVHDDRENGWSVKCPDCGIAYWGYFIWVDPDGTQAIWPSDDPEDSEVRCYSMQIPAALVNMLGELTNLPEFAKLDLHPILGPNKEVPTEDIRPLLSCHSREALIQLRALFEAKFGWKGSWKGFFISESPKAGDAYSDDSRVFRILREGLEKILSEMVDISFATELPVFGGVKRWEINFGSDADGESQKQEVHITSLQILLIFPW